MPAVSGTACAQQTPDFVAPLAPLASAVQNDLKHAHAKSVLVIDFAENKGKPTALGHELANAFADSLRHEEGGFKVLENSAFSNLAEAYGFDPMEFQYREEMASYGRDAGANITLEGELDDSPDRVILKIQGWELKHSGAIMIFEESSELRITPEMQALLAKPAASYAPSPDNSDLNALPRSGENGYTHPDCIYCPQPEFTKAAIHHGKINGIVSLVVEIDATGVADRIGVIKGLPNGLTESAIDAVKRWKFKPATGPDGKPAAVAQIIEVEFHLYGWP
jgi:TonB family protein